MYSSKQKQTMHKRARRIEAKFLLAIVLVVTCYNSYCYHVVVVRVSWRYEWCSILSRWKLLPQQQQYAHKNSRRPTRQESIDIWSFNICFLSCSELFIHSNIHDEHDKCEYEKWAWIKRVGNNYIGGTLYTKSMIMSYVQWSIQLHSYVAQVHLWTM